MKFRLSTILLVIALICVGLGWFVDRRRFPDLEKLDSQISQSVQLGLVVGSTIKSNRIYEQLDVLSKSELAEIRTKELAKGILDMAMYDLDAANMQTPWREGSRNIGVPDRGAFLSLATKSLELLQVDSVQDFKTLLTDTNYSSSYGGRDVLINGSLDPETAEFVGRAVRASKKKN